MLMASEADNQMQPKLFEVKPSRARQKKKGSEEITTEYAPPKGLDGEQLPLYLEFHSSEDHLKRAYRSNRRRRTDRKVIEAVAAGAAARRRIEGKDYGKLVEALEDVREGHVSITRKDLDGATHYTTPAFVEGFKEKYGFEPSAVGMLIPKEKMQGQAGLAAKLGIPKWTSAISFPGKWFSKDPYDMAGLAIITDGSECAEHELLHSVYNLHKKHNDKKVMLGEDELHNISEIERDIVNEISAYRGNVQSRSEVGVREWRCRWDAVEETLRDGYLPEFIRHFCKNGFDKKKLERVADIIRSRIGAAVNAVCYMQAAGVPESTITQRLLAVGQTYGELHNNEFYSPLKDVVAWGKYTKKKAVEVRKK